MASDVVGDGRRGGFGRLLEGDGSADFGVTTEDCDCCSGERGSCQLGYVLREEMRCGGERESRVGPDLCGVGWIGFGGEVETMGEKCKWKVV